MPAADDDWRLMGQERWLQGVELIRGLWAPENPSNDHDHCEFCTVHLADHVLEDDPDTQLEGYSTLDRSRWICVPCFEDFKDRFQWRVVSGAA